MKDIKTWKFISIFSYLLIILTGQMNGLPFFFWLLTTLFDFGNSNQLFAFLAIIGLTIIIINRNKTRNLTILIMDLICFILLASPLARRMKAIPIEKFNYFVFIIPTIIFILFYFVSIYFSIRQYLQVQKAKV